MSERRFPIMIPLSGERLSIPWGVVAPFERRAQQNHSQTLQRLAERGGLDPMELWAVVNDISFREAEKQITMAKALEYARELSKPKAESSFAVRSILLTPEQRESLSIGSKVPMASSPSSLEQALQRIAELESEVASLKEQRGKPSKLSSDDSCELTLSDAKARVSSMIAEYSHHWSFADGLQSALNIFNRVSEFDDVTRAVMWLIGEQGRVILWRGEWLEIVDFEWYVRIDPLAEAERLNWREWLRENT